MLICESCGAVFEYAASQMDNETGYIEQFCPECHSTYIMQAVKCEYCGDWVAEDDAFGFGHTVCEDCLNEQREDLDLLYEATKDDVTEFDLPELFRTFFTDDEIYEVLMRELKACHEVSRRDTKNFVRRFANEIADKMVEEMEGKDEN